MDVFLASKDDKRKALSLEDFAEKLVKGYKNFFINAVQFFSTKDGEQEVKPEKADVLWFSFVCPFSLITEQFVL